MGLELTPVLICDGEGCTSRHVGCTLRHFTVPRFDWSLSNLADAWGRFAWLRVMLGVYWREVQHSDGWSVVRRGVWGRDRFYCPGCQVRLRPVPLAAPGR